MKSARDTLLETRVLEVVAAWPGAGAGLDGEAPRLVIDLERTTGTSPLQVSARREDDWLLLDAPVRGRPQLDATTLLARSAGLAGGVKFTAARGSLRSAAWRMRTELPLTEDICFGRALCNALRGFAMAAGGIAYPDAPVIDAAVGRELVTRAAEVLRAAGFTVNERPNGSSWIDLETGAAAGGYAQAEFVVDDEGATLRCTLSAGNPTYPESVAAVSSVCMHANASVRLARMVMAPDGELRAEVVLGSAPGEGFVRAAAEALSVLVAMLRAECGVLSSDPEVAKHYRGRSSPTAPAAGSTRERRTKTTARARPELPASA